MSTEAALDSALIAQARAAIRAQARRIAWLARQPLEPQTFWREFLDRLIEALAAPGGVVWLDEGQGRLVPLAARSFPLELEPIELPAADRHAALLESCLSRHTGRAVDLPAVGSDCRLQEPDGRSLLIQPIEVDGRPVGLIELVQRDTADLQTRRGYLRFLEQMSRHAGQYLHRRPAAPAITSSASDPLVRFIRDVHASLDLDRTACVVANEGYRLLACDRLSVAICGGRSCRLVAISGQDVFDRRANLVRLLERLGSVAAASGEPLWDEGDDASLAPQVEQALKRYIDASHTRSLAVLPLRRPAAEGGAGQGPAAALLIAERIDAVWSDTARTRAVALCKHAGTALGNALEHHAVFLLPVWRALGRWRQLAARGTWTRIGVIAAAIATAAGALLFVPADFTVQVRGTLQPVVRRNIFAPLDGVVDRIAVESGQAVAAGAVLLVLRNTDHELAVTELTGRRLAAREQLASVERALFDEGRRLSVDDRNRLAGQKSELKQRIASLDEQYRWLEQKGSLLNVRSPIDGQVVSWKVADRLAHRPVRTGQVLLTVVDPAGAWELELSIPERRMGHVSRAQQELGGPLGVRFIPATDPGTCQNDTLEQLDLTADVDADEGSVLLGRVAVDNSRLGHPRPGAEVRAQVHCGTKPLGYVLLHELIEFVQARILFHL